MPRSATASKSRVKPHKEPVAPLSSYRKRWREKTENQHWVRDIADPLARWINRHCFDNKAKVEVAGPFGIAARVSLYFVVTATKQRSDGTYARDTYQMTLEPELSRRGVYFYRTMWGKKRDGVSYPEGSIGAVNQLDVASEPVPASPTPSWFLSRFSKTTTYHDVDGNLIRDKK